MKSRAAVLRTTPATALEDDQRLCTLGGMSQVQRRLQESVWGRLLADYERVGHRGPVAARAAG
jgi:hypothetical protein